MTVRWNARRAVAAVVIAGLVASGVGCGDGSTTPNAGAVKKPPGVDAPRTGGAKAATGRKGTESGLGDMTAP